MATISALEAMTRFVELLGRVAKGGEIVITGHGKPVARLMPSGAQGLDEVRGSIDGLRELQQRIRRTSRGKLTGREARAAIDERPAVTRPRRWATWLFAYRNSIGTDTATK